MYRGGIKLHANKFIFSARLLHYIAGEKGTQDVHAQCVKKCNGGGRAALATTESSLASEGQRQLAQNHHDRSRKNTGNWRIGARGGGGDTHVTNGISSSNGLSLGSHKYAQRHYTSI